jgi:hypothetical protein
MYCLRVKPVVTASRISTGEKTAPFRLAGQDCNHGEHALGSSAMTELIRRKNSPEPHHEK